MPGATAVASNESAVVDIGLTLRRGTLSATPFPDSGDARHDFLVHLRLVAEFLAPPVGALIRDMVGDAQK